MTGQTWMMERGGHDRADMGRGRHDVLPSLLRHASGHGLQPSLPLESPAF